MEPDATYQYDSSPTGDGDVQFLDLTNGAGGEGEDSYDEEDEPTQRPGTSSSSIKGGKYDSTAPPGKVVETGQEHTGRWTKEEHEAFLTALRTYGKEWKKVAAKVKTRTVVQTRTHAQKYFQKLQKVVGSGEKDVSNVEMGVASEARRAASLQKKKQRLAASATKVARQNSVTSAAHLISNLSERPPATAYETLPSAFSKPQLPIVGHKSSLFPASHGFSTFSSSTAAASSSAEAEYAFSSTGFAKTTVSKAAAFPMKIVAPEHDLAMKLGKFPEPSPAACGKRKLAEIAAARMLAGVAGLGQGGRDKALTSSAMDDGTATPPPEEEDAKADVKELPAPPISLGKNIDSLLNRKPLGLSLQIVNPETLGVSYESQRRRKGGQRSPQTPWEDQLLALVSEEKKKGPLQDGSLGIPRAPDMDGFGTNASPHPVCGPGSSYNRNPLHKAVCEMDLAIIQIELSSRPSEFFQRADSKGFCPIHSACSLCMKHEQNSSIATDIVRMMITAGADVSVADSNGNTPLHWAARAGDKATAEFLLFKNSPRDAKNDRGETPLHWALRAGIIGMPVASVLLENGARPAVWSKDFKRPIDVAADGFHDDEGSVIEMKRLVNQRKRLSKEQRKILKEAAEQRKEARANLLMLSAQSRTLVLHHPECLQHIPKSASDWENPDRVTSIMDKLLGKSTSTRPIQEHEISVTQEFEKATLKLLSTIHSTDYISFVNDLSKDLERQHKELNGGDNEDSAEEEGKTGINPPVVPFTPMVQRSMTKIAESSVKLGQHSDTSFSVGSLRAARRAAGAVQHAVDCVLIGRNRNAFCIVRPPGHHAGINGLLDGGESCGFCIFNSVAAGAMHAISDERLLCERCAIVDIDVHHGNGTEEIVRNCNDPGKLFFFSIHVYDNERKGKRETKSFQYKFYPGTGDEDDVALNIINVPIAPLWKEKELASSSGSTHNTRHRRRQRSSRESDDGSEAETPKGSDGESEPSTRGMTSGTSTPTNPNIAAAATTSGRVAYRLAIQNRLLPALRAFNPDLILISTGFDACKGDVGNAKHEFGGKERMGMDLEPEDYAWTTRKILEIADICCQGRVVSVLEGGYGKTPATANPEANQPLDKSMFSECAMRHVHAMIDPYDAEARFGSSSKE